MTEYVILLSVVLGCVAAFGVFGESVMCAILGERDALVTKQALHGATRCFVRGTLVATRAGLRPIEGVRPGDLVLSRDGDSGAVLEKRVSETFVTPEAGLVDVVLRESPSVIRATPGHPFYTRDRGWIEARALAVGEPLVDVRGAEVHVARVSTVAEHATVYNFEVEETHTYFVGEAAVLVHNPTTTDCNGDSVESIPGVTGSGAGASAFNPGRAQATTGTSIVTAQGTISDPDPQNARAQKLAADTLAAANAADLAFLTDLNKPPRDERIYTALGSLDGTLATVADAANFVHNPTASGLASVATAAGIDKRQADLIKNPLVKDRIDKAFKDGHVAEHVSDALSAVGVGKEAQDTSVAVLNAMTGNTASMVKMAAQGVYGVGKVIEGVVVVRRLNEIRAQIPVGPENDAARALASYTILQQSRHATSYVRDVGLDASSLIPVVGPWTGKVVGGIKTVYAKTHKPDTAEREAAAYVLMHEAYTAKNPYARRIADEIYGAQSSERLGQEWVRVQSAQKAMAEAAEKGPYPNAAAEKAARGKSIDASKAWRNQLEFIDTYSGSLPVPHGTHLTAKDTTPSWSKENGFMHLIEDPKVKEYRASHVGEGSPIPDFGYPIGSFSENPVANNAGGGASANTTLTQQGTLIIQSAASRFSPNHT